MKKDKPFGVLEIETSLLHGPELNLLVAKLGQRENRVYGMLCYFWRTVSMEAPRGRIAPKKARLWLADAANQNEVNLPIDQIMDTMIEHDWLREIDGDLIPAGWSRYDKIFESREKDAQYQANRRATSRRSSGTVGPTISESPSCPIPIPIPIPDSKPNTNHATACSDMLIPSPEAPQSLQAQNPTPDTPKGKKRRRSLPAVSLSPELTGLVDRWRKPVNKRIVAELVAKRVEEGYTEAEMVAGGDDYLSTRKGQEARFDMMLETFVGPALHFKTEWIKRVARPKPTADDRKVMERQRESAEQYRRNEAYTALMAKRKREAVAAGQEFIATPEIIAAVNAELDREFGEGKA